MAMPSIELARLRRRITTGEIGVCITGHADIEARKDGLTAADIGQALMAGERIEDYPERDRCLLLTFSEGNLPVHVCIEYVGGDKEVVVVTAYVPQASEWERFRKRRRR
jgi:hypothetical protein